jgi:hypothetical protein
VLEDIVVVRVADEDTESDDIVLSDTAAVRDTEGDEEPDT